MKHTNMSRQQKQGSAMNTDSTYLATGPTAATGSVTVDIVDEIIKTNEGKETKILEQLEVVFHLFQHVPTVSAALFSTSRHHIFKGLVHSHGENGGRGFGCCELGGCPE